MKIPDTIHVHGTSAPELDVKLPYHIEYTRTDAFIEKAKKWFEIQNEGVDSDGNYKCDMTDFEDFRNFMKGE